MEKPNIETENGVNKKIAIASIILGVTHAAILYGGYLAFFKPGLSYSENNLVSSKVAICHVNDEKGRVCTLEPAFLLNDVFQCLPGHSECMHILSQQLYSRALLEDLSDAANFTEDNLAVFHCNRSVDSCAMETSTPKIPTEIYTCENSDCVDMQSNNKANLENLL